MTSWKVSNTNNTIARHIYWIIMFKIIYRSIFLMTNCIIYLWIFSSFLPRVDCFAQNRCAKKQIYFHLPMSQNFPEYSSGHSHRKDAGTHVPLFWHGLDMQSASVGKKGAYGLHYEQTSCSLTKTMNCEWCKCTLILVQWKCFKKKFASSLLHVIIVYRTVELFSTYVIKIHRKSRIYLIACIL